jgi:hypothetical protein
VIELYKDTTTQRISICSHYIAILKQKRFYSKTQTKSLKIKEINQENPENHFNLGIKMIVYQSVPCWE